jgi:hypothetical protein
MATVPGRNAQGETFALRYRPAKFAQSRKSRQSADFAGERRRLLILASGAVKF